MLHNRGRKYQLPPKGPALPPPIGCQPKKENLVNCWSISFQILLEAALHLEIKPFKIKTRIFTKLWGWEEFQKGTFTKKN